MKRETKQGEDQHDAPLKFHDLNVTTDGNERASVPFARLETLWINTGTLCNVACTHCYIESSPTNDRLVYVTLEDVLPHVDAAKTMGATTIGFTGGEPFMNRQMIDMLSAVLERGFGALVLTNAMQPMMRKHVQSGLLLLQENYGDQLKLRVSVDHHTEGLHDAERGQGAFMQTQKGLAWLFQNGFSVSIAGRTLWGENQAQARLGYEKLFAEEGYPLDASSSEDLVLFPEMNSHDDTPEITTQCWDILGVRPQDMMCASSRMVVKRKGAKQATVLACTLLAYDTAFEMGVTLEEAVAKPVKLNHPYCSKFCVLGGATCSG